MILNGFPVSTAGDEHIRRKRRWTHKFLIGSVELCLTFDQTRHHWTATSSPKKKTWPAKFLSNLTISSPQKIANLAFLSKQPWTFANLFHRYTNPLVVVRYRGPSAPCLYSVVHHKSSPQTSQIFLDFGHNKWQNMVGWFFCCFVFLPLHMPNTSNDQPAIIVGSRAKLQVILLGGYRRYP